MKKYAFTLLAILTIVTSSCSKDDKTPTPDPYKVTSITCTKNGVLTDGFSINIQYNTAGNVSAIIDINNSITYNYQYNDNKIYLVSNADDLTQTEYTLSGNRIVSQTRYGYNPYNAGQQYKLDVYTYEYSGSSWVNTKMEGNRIDESKGELYSYKSNVDHRFTWKSNCIATYAAGNNILEFDYDPVEHPVNFPFRIINNLALENGKLAGTFVSQESFSPMNLLMGNNNRYLVKSAKWYINPDININLTEYEFEYSTNSEGYVTKVDIEETIYNGNEKETNLYVISLNYEFNPNK
ncbi:MAG: DUF5032 domain-containing protein [Tannerellaceae bacterium]|nr:DUF5032 domain-containing protein [Tannerellaceae bacterium]